MSTPTRGTIFFQSTIKIFLIPWLFLAFFGCGSNGTESGDPTSGQSNLEIILPELDASQVTLFKFCLEEIHFFNLSDDTTPAETVTGNPAEVALSSEVTNISLPSPASGSYQKVVFALSPNCESGEILEVENSQGLFQVQSEAEMTFQGEFDLTGPLVTLTLDFANIFTSLGQATNNGDLESRLLNAVGTY